MACFLMIWTQVLAQIKIWLRSHKKDLFKDSVVPRAIISQQTETLSTRICTKLFFKRLFFFIDCCNIFKNCSYLILSYILES